MPFCNELFWQATWADGSGVQNSIETGNSKKASLSLHISLRSLLFERAEKAETKERQRLKEKYGVSYVLTSEEVWIFCLLLGESAIGCCRHAAVLSAV